MNTPVISHYETLGGDTGIRQLVNRFYDIMDTAPEAAAVRALHAASLKQSREKLILYLTGWTGGPPVYVEKYGHPRLRARHMPFAIGSVERDQWLWCMKLAIDEQQLPDAFVAELWQKLRQVADFMRNQPDDDAAGLTVF